jgi:hypothetical protein
VPRGVGEGERGGVAFGGLRIVSAGVDGVHGWDGLRLSVRIEWMGWIGADGKCVHGLFCARFSWHGLFFSFS